MILQSIFCKKVKVNVSSLTHVHLSFLERVGVIDHGGWWASCSSKAHCVIPDVVLVMTLFWKGELRTNEAGNTTDAYNVWFESFTTEDVYSENSCTLFKVSSKICGVILRKWRKKYEHGKINIYLIIFKK